MKECFSGGSVPGMTFLLVSDCAKKHQLFLVYSWELYVLLIGPDSDEP